MQLHENLRHLENNDKLLICFLLEEMRYIEYIKVNKSESISEIKLTIFARKGHYTFPINKAMFYFLKPLLEDNANIDREGVIYTKPILEHGYNARDPLFEYMINSIEQMQLFLKEVLESKDKVYLSEEEFKRQYDIDMRNLVKDLSTASLSKMTESTEERTNGKFTK